MAAPSPVPSTRGSVRAGCPGKLGTQGTGAPRGGEMPPGATEQALGSYLQGCGWPWGVLQPARAAHRGSWRQEHPRHTSKGQIPAANMPHPWYSLPPEAWATQWPWQGCRSLCVSSPPLLQSRPGGSPVKQLCATATMVIKPLHKHFKILHLAPVLCSLPMEGVAGAGDPAKPLAALLLSVMRGHPWCRGSRAEHRSSSPPWHRSSSRLGSPRSAAPALSPSLLDAAGPAGTWRCAAVIRPVALKSSERTMEKRVELLLWLVVTDPKAPRTVNIAWIFSTGTQHQQPLSRRRGQLLLLAAPPAPPAHTMTRPAPGQRLCRQEGLCQPLAGACRALSPPGPRSPELLSS